MKNIIVVLSFPYRIVRLFRKDAKMVSAGVNEGCHTTTSLSSSSPILNGKVYFSNHVYMHQVRPETLWCHRARLIWRYWKCSASCTCAAGP